MNIFQFRRNDNLPEDSDIDEVIEGERDAAAMRRGLRIQGKVTNLIIVASVVTLAGLALWRYYASVYDRHEEAVEPANDAATMVPDALPPLKTPAFPEPRRDAALSAMTPAASETTLQTGQTAPASSAATAGASQVLTPAQQRMKQRLESPLVFNTPGSQTTRNVMPEAAAGAGGAVGTSPTGGAASSANRPLRGSATRAYLLADPSMTITQGTKIPCHVIEALDTTLPGLVTCIQIEDVRSADGRVVLLERGTKWVGEQANGIAQGQRRVGIVWSRGETPNHVLVDVDSAGADSLGRPGIAGDVDRHFWDRFGAAILLSVIGDVGPYLTALRQGGGNNNTTIAFPNITGGAQQVMSDVLKSTLNIPPTLTAPEASRIVIHVARDLDFRDVYALQERPTPIQ